MEEKQPTIVRRQSKRDTQGFFNRSQKKKESMISQSNEKKQRKSTQVYPNFQKHTQQNSSSASNSDSNESLDIRQLNLQKEREQHLYNASLAEQIENYEQMTNFMRKIIDMDRNSDLMQILLNKDELQFIQRAFQNIVNKRRIAIRAIKKLEYKERQKQPSVLETIKYYRNKIQDELEQICNEVIDIVELYFDYFVQKQNELKEKKKKKEQKEKTNQREKIIEKNEKNEKNDKNDKDDKKEKDEKKEKEKEEEQGDYNRYLSELTDEDLQQKVIEQAQEAYQGAWKKIIDQENQKDSKKQDLIPKTSTLRIGLGMNYSVLLYEQKKQLKQAYEIAKKTFEDAFADKDQDLEDEEYKDMIQPLQLLRENIKNWQEEIQELEKGDDSDQNL